MKMWKVYRQIDGETDRQTTDDRWSEKLTWAFSSGELKSEKFAHKYGQQTKYDQNSSLESWGLFNQQLLLIILGINDIITGEHCNSYLKNCFGSQKQKFSIIT